MNMMSRRPILAVAVAAAVLTAASVAGAEVYVSLPDTTAARSETLYIPIWTSDVTGQGVYSYQFIMSFDSTFIRILDVINDGSITDVGPWMGPAWFIKDGEESLRVASAGTEPLEGAGLFVSVVVEVLGTAPSDSSIYLGLHDFILNEGTPSTVPDGGWLLITSTGVERVRDEDAGPVKVVRLSPTSVRWELATADTHESRLEIYDAFGKFVASVDPSGGDEAVTFTWNGRNSDGGAVSGGVYFYRLSSGPKQYSGKVCILK
jgi:hypothetical protein